MCHNGHPRDMMHLKTLHKIKSESNNDNRLTLETKDLYELCVKE